MSAAWIDDDPVPVEETIGFDVTANGHDPEADLDLSYGPNPFPPGWTPDTAPVTLEPFAGLSHAEVLELDFGDEPADLIDGLIPKGVVVTTAGLPETYKGWVATKKAELVASGQGDLFGCKAVAQGWVGYWWQDDSTRNEAERVQLYARVHDTPPDLPIRWFLNEGLELPRDLDRLRATIDHFGFVYVVIDSFYNVAVGADLKEREAGVIFAAVKTHVCDPTGCTVDIVDHMPWATDTNRKRLRGYGDVFKNAAVRAGLYIDADGSKLYVEARGNSIRGFKKTPAYWDEERLELRLVDVDRGAQEALDEEVLAFVLDHPGQSTSAIADGLEKSPNTVRPALKRLSSCENAQTAQNLVCKTSRDLGTAGTGHYWFPHNQEASEPSDLFEMAQDGSPLAAELAAEPSQPSAPRRGDGSADGSLEPDEELTWR